MGMAIKKPAIIMALYDIGRDNWDHFTVSYNTYLAWMRNTLSLDACFVIYTEAKFYDKIVEYRKEFDPELKKTVIVVTPLEELDCYKLYEERLQNVMFTEEFKEKDHHKVPEMTKPLYNIIMFNKVNFLKHAKDSKYFDADLLIWADAGGLREDVSNYKGEVWPSLEKLNKLDPNKITFFSHNSDFDVEDKSFYAMSQIRNIQGTAFLVPTNMIDELLIEFNQTIEECLSADYIGSDEKIFDITYCKNKSKYNLIKCTWRTYFDLFKESRKIGSYMKLKLITATWSHEDSFDIYKTSLYKSFKQFNPTIDVEHFHFNRDHHQQQEQNFSARFGAESEYLLYKIQFLLEKVKKINSDYIIFYDANDVTCMRPVDYLLDMFDLEQTIVVGHEKNIWPTQERKNSWPNYTDYSEQDKNNRTFLNSGMILSRTDKFIEMLQSMIDNVFSTEITTFNNDQGVYTYYYNMGMQPKIKLDYGNIFAVNTFCRNIDEFYLNKNNRLVSYETGVMPCFVHDNGWNHGSPKYFEFFDLQKIYSSKKNIPEYLSGDGLDYYVLTDAIKEIKNVPGIICEIGTRRGGSVINMIEALIQNDDKDRNIICIDPYGDMEYSIAEGIMIPGCYDNKMRNEFLTSIYDYILNKPVNLLLFNFEDTEFFERFSDGVPIYNRGKSIINQYAFVFFDGPHDTTSIMKEIDFFNSRSVTGAVWVFDDVTDHYPHEEIIEKWLFENGWSLLKKTSKKASYIKI